MFNLIKRSTYVFLILFLFVAGYSVFFVDYAFLKLLIWVAIAFLISLVKPRVVFGVLAVGGVTEALIGFFQFWQQKSLGLQFLGESLLGVSNLEIARVYVNPGLLLRAYGTFPHPNILAAFLILSLISLFYFFLKQETGARRAVILIGIFIVMLGLILTFARAAWLIASVVSVVFLLASWNFGFDKKRIWQLGVMIILSIVVVTAIFHWAVLPRLSALTPDNFTIQERLVDYQQAKQLIASKLWFGHGLTLAMGERPIHNLYLLVATEIGLLGLGAFLLLLGSLYWEGFVKWDKTTALIMLSALLLYGLFDHFLWTLRPGIGMFFLIIGIVLYNKRV